MATVSTAPRVAAPARADLGCAPAERSHYTTGLCHALALALHARTGWPMVAIWGEEGGDECLAHLAVEHPADPAWVIDALGVRPLRDAIEQYHDLAGPWSDTASVADIRRWIEDEDRLHELDATDLADANAVAERMLAALGSLAE